MSTPEKKRMPLTKLELAENAKRIRIIQAIRVAPGTDRIDVDDVARTATQRGESENESESEDEDDDVESGDDTYAKVVDASNSEDEEEVESYDDSEAVTQRNMDDRNDVVESSDVDEPKVERYTGVPNGVPIIRATPPMGVSRD